jgi:hypothetical protein
MEDLLYRESNGGMRKNNIGRIQIYEKVVILMDIKFSVEINNREEG